MRSARPTGPFKKDLKRISRRGYDLEKLRQLILLIQNGNAIPSSARLHKLSGEYEGFWECHLEPDWLLIYGVTEEEIALVRTGSHVDLFA